MKINYILYQGINTKFKPIATFDSEEKAWAWVENNISKREHGEFMIEPIRVNPTGTGFVDREDVLTAEQMKEVEQYLAEKYRVEL